ncbi:OmpA family protein [Spirillospora sp. CA-294931]|uniref:OmpA family protein n=1 Tax=Spirillospora sp. CA-294931 TaxID=3240042 RepID=UPI003D8A4EEB
MRRPTVLAATFALLVGIPSIATADPDVPATNAANAVRAINANGSIRSIQPDAHVRTIDPSKFVVPLQSEESNGARVTVRISADVLFDFNKATLTPIARRKLAELAPRLSHANGKIEVSGHSDSVGAPDYNLRLSEQRAQAVKAELERALTQARIEAKGYGETKPVALNQLNNKDNPDGRAKNRRVDITFTK